jgi:hypothetical protein
MLSSTVNRKHPSSRQKVFPAQRPRATFARVNPRSAAKSAPINHSFSIDSDRVESNSYLIENNRHTQFSKSFHICRLRIAHAYFSWKSFEFSFLQIGYRGCTSLLLGQRSLTPSAPPRAPLFRRNLPNLRWKSSAHILRFLSGDHAHSASLRNFPRCHIRHSLRRAQHRKSQHIEPIIRRRIHCFRHQSLALPIQPEPEAAIVSLALPQRNRSDEQPRFALQPQRPMPLFAALHRRKYYVANVCERAVRWKRPRRAMVQKSHNLPVRKNPLRLRRVRKFQRPQNHPRSLQRFHSQILTNAALGFVAEAFRPPGFERRARAADTLRALWRDADTLRVHRQKRRHDR